MAETPEMARTLVLEYYASVFMLYSMYDGTENKEEVTKILREHPERFTERLK